MSNTSKGNRAEIRIKAIFHRMGWTLAAEAKRTPVWRNGRVIANDGAIDLVRNSIDLIFIKKGEPVLFVQSCHRGGESPRRQKLRAIDWDDAHHRVLLLAFDLEAQHFRAYRREEDYAECGWRLEKDATSLPWENPQIQVKLQ